MPSAPPDSPGDTLTLVESALHTKRAAEAAILLGAAHWVDQHPGEMVPGTRWEVRGSEQVIKIGGEGTPKVEEFAHAELAVSLQIHPLAARSLMADALDLRHRFPALWHLVTVDLSVPDWVARKIARLTRQLTTRQVAEVDRHLAPIAATLPPSRLLTVVEGLVLASRDEEADAERRRRLTHRFVTISSGQNGRHSETPASLPTIFGRLDETDAIRIEATIARLAQRLADAGDTDDVDLRRSKAVGLLADPDRARAVLAGPASETGATLERLAPPVTLYLHLTQDAFICHEGGVARFEQGGPITLAHAREILGHSRVTIRPVLDLADRTPADAYEFTGSLRERVLHRTPADTYPYAVKVGRSGGFDMEIDHTDPHQRHGPPGRAGRTGRTESGNGGPMTRHHHRIKTHGRLAVRQPRPGLYVWRTPHRRYLAVDHRGTRRISQSLGDALFSSTSRAERKFAAVLISH